MARLGDVFDPAEVEADDRSFDPMPAGDYICQIIESDVVKTSKGGDMLKLTIEVMEGPYERRRVWDNLNIRNANPDAQRIAHQTLSALCKACGTGPIEDSEELHGIPFCATIKIEPEREANGRTYDARNAVKRYKPRAAANTETKAPERPRAGPSKAAGAAKPASGSSRPWGNGAGRTAPKPVAHHDDPPF